MFTQCSKCETVFRLSAHALRAAGGQVRCGRCGEVFNALARLAEESTGFTRGESSLELEARADEILEALEPVPPIDAAAEEPAQAPAGEADEPVSDALLEFTLPPGELDRIFIETTPSVLQLLSPEVKQSERGPYTPAQPLLVLPGGAESAVSERVPLEFLPQPESVLTLAARAAAAAPLAATAAPAPVTATAPRGLPQPAAPVHSSAGARRLAFENEAREVADLPEISGLRRRLSYPTWISAAVVFTLLLAAQLVMSNQDWFAAHASLLGIKVAARPQLSAYQLKQWGVTGDPGANGALRVRATIENTAAAAQPYPLLRVTLADRFGTRIARREFEPSEYLGKPPVGLLAGGAHADALLTVQDPGKDAEGFEIDICIRAADRRVSCAGDVPAAAAATQGK